MCPRCRSPEPPSKLAQFLQQVWGACMQHKLQHMVSCLHTCMCWCRQAQRAWPTAGHAQGGCLSHLTWPLTFTLLPYTHPTPKRVTTAVVPAGSSMLRMAAAACCRERAGLTTKEMVEGYIIHSLVAAPPLVLCCRFRERPREVVILQLCLLQVRQRPQVCWQRPGKLVAVQQQPLQLGEGAESVR